MSKEGSDCFMRRRGEDNGGCRDRDTVDVIIEDAVVPELRRNVIVQTGSIDLRYHRYPKILGQEKRHNRMPSFTYPSPSS